MPKRTIREAIVQAFKKAGEPMSVKDIYAKIIELDYYRFRAENPQHIVLTEIRRHCEGVDFPTAQPDKHYQILRDGRYWIKGVAIPGNAQSVAKLTPQSDKETAGVKGIVEELKAIHGKHEEAFKALVLNQLKSIDPKAFELFSKKLLEVYGFVDVHVTSYSKDGGIDGYGKLKVGITFLNVAFQCKRWKNTTVGRPQVSQFRGDIQGEYEQGIIFTTSTFSTEAQEATTKKGAVPVILVDGPTLIDIMIEKRFGVDYETMPVYISALDRVLTEDI